MKETFSPNNIFQVVGLLFAALLLATPFFYFIDIRSLTANPLYPTIFFAIFCLLFIGISLWVNYRRKQKIQWNFKIVSFRLLSLMLLLLVVFPIGINKPVNNLFGQLFNFKHELSNPFDRPLLLFGTVLLAPILEEIIFRGIILKGLLTRYTPKYAIILSAIVFGLVHGKPLQIWGAFVLGIFFGWIYYKTNSIGTTILLHSFANFVVLIKTYLTFKYVDLEDLNTINIALITISRPMIFIILKPLKLKLNHNKNLNPNSL